MTTARPGAALPPLVADAMVLHHFARADRLDVVGASVSQMATTHIVSREVDKYCNTYPTLRSITDLK
jgi:hypothetical protein